MKKLVFMFVAVAAISFASCGNKDKAAQNADSTTVDTTATTDSADTDSAATDTAAAATDTAAAPVK